MTQLRENIDQTGKFLFWNRNFARGYVWNSVGRANKSKRTQILPFRLKFKCNSYISLTGAISMIGFIFQLDVMDLQVPFNCSNNELGCCIGPFSSFSMDWHVVKSFWSSFSSITLTTLMLFKLWHHGFFGEFPEILQGIIIVVDIWLLLSFFLSTQENENQSNVIWLKLSNKKNMLTRIPSLNSFFGKSRRPTAFEII